MQVTQCSLTSLDGTAKMVAWIDTGTLRRGTVITLKGTIEPERLWRIVSLGKKMEKSEMKRSDVFDSIKPKR